jgi:hypothetical protein
MMEGDRPVIIDFGSSIYCATEELPGFRGNWVAIGLVGQAQRPGREDRILHSGSTWPRLTGNQSHQSVRFVASRGRLCALLILLGSTRLRRNNIRKDSNTKLRRFTSRGNR